MFDVGGSIAGEHGYGLSRTEFLRRQAGPLYEVFDEIKRIFDPENLFNPGKIVSDGASTMARNLSPPLKIAVDSPPHRSSRRIRPPPFRDRRKRRRRCGIWWNCSWIGSRRR